jgi:hypothetical protein
MLLPALRVTIGLKNEFTGTKVANAWVDRLLIGAIHPSGKPVKRGLSEVAGMIPMDGLA